jgi:hypothetical protein
MRPGRLQPKAGRPSVIVLETGLLLMTAVMEHESRAGDAGEEGDPVDAEPFGGRWRLEEGLMCREGPPVCESRANRDLAWVNGSQIGFDSFGSA